MNSKTILIASDHAGFVLKGELAAFLRSEMNEWEVRDMGPLSFDEQDDYPRTLDPLLKLVEIKPDEYKAIIIGGSGQGEAIVANRRKGIRATVLYSFHEEIVKLARQHNDANVLSLGARFLSADEAKKAVKLWLNTGFSGEEKHRRRIEQIDHL